MTEYSFCSIHADTDLIASTEIIECESDKAARDLASKRQDDKIVEVWEGARFIIRLPPIQR